MPAVLQSQPVVTPVRVALIEDDRAYRESLATLLHGAPEFRCVGTFKNGEEALRTIPTLEVDVVLLDLALGKVSGLECIRRLHDQRPGLQLLVLSQFDDVDKVFDAIKAGAHGYIWKRASLVRIVEAIHEVHRGGVPITPHLARRVLDYFRRDLRERSKPGVQLQEHEVAVLELVTQGLTNQEICAKLHKSEATIKGYVSDIFVKLQVKSRAGAVGKYLKWWK